MIYRLGLLALFCLTAPLAVAQTPGVMTIVGTGKVSRAPDMAVISVGVELDAPSAAKVLALNSVRMRAVFKVLKDAGIAAKDMQTSQFSLHPQWNSRNSSSGKPPSINGYVASNLLTIRVLELASLGKVLDALTKSGANRIQGIQFNLQEPQPHLDEAHRLAILDAGRKARLFSAAAEVELGAILSISEGQQGGFQPVFRASAAYAEAVPIAEGQLDLSATVTITYSFAQD